VHLSPVPGEVILHIEFEYAVRSAPEFCPGFVLTTGLSQWNRDPATEHCEVYPPLIQNLHGRTTLDRW